MTRGVFYYNHGERCLVRLAVSLFSLRKHYSGPVTIAAEGTPPDWFTEIAKELKADFIPAPQSGEYGLLKKSRLWRIMPYDVTLFLDADTLVRAPVDELLDHTEKHGIVVTRFHDWRTNGRRMKGRIRQWEKIEPKAVHAALNKYEWAINTGVMGWTRGNPLLPEYEAMTAKGLTDRSIGKKTLDEIAMQLVVPFHKHYLAGSEWNVGPIHGKIEGAKIFHYHGHKHCRPNVPACDLWKEEFLALAEAFPKYADELTREHQPDGSIGKWMRDDFGQRKDLTIVTAVNPKYAEPCKKNMERWMHTPGLKEQKFIVFVNGFANAKDRTFLEYPNVKVVRWAYPFEASQRETMLAAFILGVADNVKTPYWMKLDCDTTPKKNHFKWPDYRKATITSSPWHYTKCKSDDHLHEKGHWFNRLDAVFSPDAPIFPKMDVDKHFKVSHRPGNEFGIPKRFGSFAHIERTEFTKKIAEIIRSECDGRLPIPSQDTISWYCAYLWKEKVSLVNMREWLQP